MKYSIEKDSCIGNYLVYRISFFGFKKKCIARMNTLESANTLVSFLIEMKMLLLTYFKKV